MYRGEEEEPREEAWLKAIKLGQVCGHESFHPQNGEREQGLCCAAR